MKNEIAELENQEKELRTYREKIISDGEKLPEGIRQLNKIMIDNINSEIDDNKKQLASKRRNLTLISNKLQKKLIFALGENFTSEQKATYIKQLQNQRKNLETQIEKGLGKKQALIRLLQAQYEAEQKADLHSVQKLTEELTKKILIFHNKE